MSLYECVPNVSQGRCPATIERLSEAIEDGGARLLHRTSDADHHRTVFTLAGSASSLEQSLLALYRASLQEIDLRQHRGVHPRIGVVDVTPVVSLTSEAGVRADRLIERLGTEIADRFQLPVFRYARSATGSGRRRLADLRRGGPAGLAKRMAAGLEPDYGPRRLHPSAGATALGVRGFLIAWNVLLDSADLRSARRIAQRVRASSGGLPGVQALGIFLRSEGRAQVSMNLLDFRKTPIYQLVERVRFEARQLGVGVVGSELIGLIPRAALDGGALEDLQLLDFSDDRVLENRLQATGLITADSVEA